MSAGFNMVYQIFPDRFAIGSSATMDLKVERGLYSDNVIPMKWSELPRTTGRLGFQHFGGDICGIIDNLDYISGLGFDSIYITPVHDAETYHRYDCRDYRSVAKELGGMEAFEKLICELHNRNMKIIMDLVLNHLSYKHEFFIKALEGNEKYRAFFNFNKDGSYDCWWGHPNMPELNLSNPDVLSEFITGENSVLNFWIDKGVDGFRLDCANDLGIEICSLINSAAKKRNSDVFVLGEVFHYGVQWLKALDGIQSYYSVNSIYSLLSGEISAVQFGKNMEGLYSEASSLGGINRSWNMLSSHDYPRVMTTLDFNYGKIELALMLQFLLPGTPMVYYGDENGMKGGDDPHNRAPMIWDEKKWNSRVRSFYRKMIELRRQRTELSEGSFIDLSSWLDNGVVGFIRILDSDQRNYCVVFINPTGENKKFKAFLPLPYMFSDMDMIDVLNGSRAKSMSGSLYVDLPAYGGSVYIPDFFCKKNYRFSKRL